MKIEDKIYVPHVCPECNAVRLIPRDDLHDNPTIICTECGAEMSRWVTHKENPMPVFGNDGGHYLTYTQKLKEITGTPWDQVNGSSLVDVRKKVGEDLVDYPGMPGMVLLPSEYVAAQLRAKLMKDRTEDIVVTLVYQAIYRGVNSKPSGSLRVESILYSQMDDRITKLKRDVVDGTVKVIMAYSEETHQQFIWNDMKTVVQPRMSKYDQKYDRKRKSYRNTTDGVL